MSNQAIETDQRTKRFGNVVAVDGIIHNGKLIKELDTEKLEQLRAKRLEIRTRNVGAAQTSLQSTGYKFAMKDEMIVIDSEYAIEHPDDIARLLAMRWAQACSQFYCYHLLPCSPALAAAISQPLDGQYSPLSCRRSPRSPVRVIGSPGLSRPYSAEPRDLVLICLDGTATSS